MWFYHLVFNRITNNHLGNVLSAEGYGKGRQIQFLVTMISHMAEPILVKLVEIVEGLCENVLAIEILEKFNFLTSLYRGFYEGH